MKKLIYFLMLVFSISTFSQNDSISKISVVSADKMNVVYRGLPNPISISAGGKSFTASGVGLTKISEGKYNLNPGSGTETFITIAIRQDDGTTKIEKHRFRILNVKNFYPLINGNAECQACILRFTLDELKDAIITVDIPDMLYDNLKFKVKSFSVYISKKESIIIDGDRFNNELLAALKSVKKGQRIIIYDIKANLPANFSMCFGNVPPITFEIYKPKIVRFKPSEEQRDSIRFKKKQERLLKRKTSQK